MLDSAAVLLSQDQFDGLGRLLRPLYVSSRVESGALRSIEVLEPNRSEIPGALLEKPFDPDRLVAEVHRLLSKGTPPGQA